MKKFKETSQSVHAGVCIAVLMTLALFLAAGAAFADKPDRGTPLPGWIYYENGYLGYKMTPDGKNVIPLDAVGEPSIRLHGGYRWILEFKPSDPPASYPNGYPRHDLYAVREDNADLCVQLTDELDLEPDPYIYSTNPRSSQEIARWSLDDTKVSFVAKRWEIVESPPGSGIYVFSGDVAEYGLFELDVDWDPVTFEPSGSPTDLILDDLDLFDETEPHMGFVGSYHDMSHDRLKVVYSKLTLEPGNQVYTHTLYCSEVTDPEAGFGPGVPVAGAEKLHGGTARLSPDGTKAVFCYGFYNEQTNSIGLIKSVNTDGSDLMTLVTPEADKGVGGAYWSPTGTHVVYYKFWITTKPWYQHFQELHRCEADGGSDKVLTSARKIHPYNLGWRGDD